MEKITYGAPRLIDWVAQIKVGAATVRVHFTGGALTSYGVTPAEFSTADPFLQKVIENSNFFKEGRIIFLRKTTVADTAKPKPKAKPQPKPAPKVQVPTPAPEAAAPQTTAPAPTPDEAQNPEPTPTAEEEVSSENEEAVAAAAADSLKSVEVSCIQDAQAYLQENFNIPTYKIRTRPAAQRAAAEHGVMFVGGGFVPVGSEEAESEQTAEAEE